MHPALFHGYGLTGIDPPAPGTARVTNTPDDARSIAFEIGQMVEHVAQSVKDPEFMPLPRDVVVPAVSELDIAHMQGGPRYLLAQVIAWFEWVKGHYTYVGDPVSYNCEGST